MTGTPNATSGIWASLERRRAQQEQQRSNTGQIASAVLYVETTGNAQQVVDPTLHTFDCTFTDTPQFAHGLEIVAGAVAPGALPRVTAGVYRWERSRDGFYTGAYLYFDVSFPGGVAGETFTLRHHCTFGGMAIRKTAESILTEVDQ